MGRPRKHATNAERQKAYRDRIRVTKLSGKSVTIPDRVDGFAWLIRECYAGGCSVKFLARRQATSHAVIRAIIAREPVVVPMQPAPAKASVRDLLADRVRLGRIFGEAA